MVSPDQRLLSTAQRSAYFIYYIFVEYLKVENESCASNLLSLRRVFKEHC